MDLELSAGAQWSLFVKMDLSCIQYIGTTDSKGATSSLPLLFFCMRDFFGCVVLFFAPPHFRCFVVAVAVSAVVPQCFAALYWEEHRDFLHGPN